jgi:NADPH2:quinone reductase
MLRGMTAEYLIRRAWPVKAGDTVLVHAAAGGLGIILTQWAKAIGLRVIGTVGSEAKAEVARGYGADEIILYDHEDVAARVRELTNGEGVPVVYDGVGKATFEGSLASLKRRGCLIAFGNASGAADPLNLGRLSRMGSLYVTRPTINDYVHTTEELDDSAAALFDMIASGKVEVEIGSERPLAEVRQAHEDLEARRTVGANILIP